MNLTDIIALAKAGYSVADVKELMNLKPNEPAQTPQEPPAETVPIENGTKDEPQPIEKPTERLEAEAVDYKSLYEESQRKLAESQKANINKNIESNNTKSDNDILAELTRSFM